MAEYKKSEEKFVNPYNFVELDDKCAKGLDYKMDKKDNDAITGWLECRLELKSPIFIPNSTNNNYFKKLIPANTEPKSYEFFSYADLSKEEGDKNNPPAKPVIPGSELKGMIRSVFEALNNSCMSTSDVNMQFHKRAPKSDKSGKAGILRQSGNSWQIVPCRRYMLKTKKCHTPQDSFIPSGTFAHWKKDLQNTEKNQGKVWFNKTTPYNKTISGREKNIGETLADASLSAAGKFKGYVHVTAGFTRKHHDSVFVETSATPIRITQDEAQNYLDNLKSYLDNDKFETEYKHLDHGNCITDYNNVCVYYTEYGGKRYLSPSMITREVYHTRLSKLLASYQPCTDKQDLCLACALFGMVSPNSAVSSRLRITDAKLVDGCKPTFDPPALLEEMSSPKPSATEFYVSRPEDCDLWNYDYAAKWKRTEVHKLKNELIIDKKYTPKIRGRKFYWHSSKNPYSNLTDKHNLSEEEKDKVNRLVFVRALKSGTFNFKIYFDRVKRADIYCLIWVLTLGNSKEHAHKIGMGKPLGLGSVQVSVNKLVRRNISALCVRGKSINDYHDEVKIPSFKAYLKSSKEAVKQVLAMTKLDNPFKDRICYPYVKNSSGERQAESYKWFVANKLISGKPNTPIIEQELPSPDKPELVVYKGKKDKHR